MGRAKSHKSVKPPPVVTSRVNLAQHSAIPARGALRVLHVVHDFLPRHQAGAELYAFQLATEQARRHHVHVLCADYAPTEPHLSLRWREHQGLPVTELINNWRFKRFEETYASPAVAERLEQVLDA